MNVAVRPNNLNIISLCTGGGGLDLGVELAMPSARSVVYMEREAFAAAHLVAAMQQGLMAQAPIWSDVTTFNGRPWRGIVDGVIGGIPCQPHSLAGKRLGADDERDLWSDARRIIVQSGAWFVLIENVRGMLSSGGAERVWRDLHRLGFAVEAGLFTASEVGASHERERILILAVADHEDWRRGARESSQQCERPEGALGGRGGELADAGRPGLQGRELSRSFEERNWPASSRSASEFCGTSLVDAVSGRHDRRTDDALGRSIERAVAKGAGCGAIPAMADTDIAQFRHKPSAGKQQIIQRDYGIGRADLFPPRPSDLTAWRGTLENSPELEPSIRRVADGLASRLDIARVDQLRMLGNGVVPLQAADAVRTLATRLSAAGSAGAAGLVRMMEIA
jgi:DNA (cytosine-5)-methyltransferase 1